MKKNCIEKWMRHMVNYSPQGNLSRHHTQPPHLKVQQNLIAAKQEILQFKHIYCFYFCGGWV